MKKTMTIILLLGFSFGHADSINEQRMAWTKSYLEKQGMPSPDGGVKIVPEAQMSTYAEMREQREKYKNDIQKYGYIKSTNPSTEQLLTIQITAAHDYKNHGNDFKPTSTHLKHSISELKMAYTFTGVPGAIVDEPIGFAPYLTYIKGQGWVGAIQFFKHNSMGNCAYSENNTKLSHGSIILAEEDVRHDVNGKTTTVEVMGTPKAGYTYTVEWFDNIFFRKLECANKKYSSELTNNVIEMAKKIDDFNQTL